MQCSANKETKQIRKFKTYKQEERATKKSKGSDKRKIREQKRNWEE